MPRSAVAQLNVPRPPREAPAEAGLYPRDMAGNRAESSPPGGSESDPDAQQGEQRRPPERYGPLELMRTRKDDGRALILYSRSKDGT